MDNINDRKDCKLISNNKMKNELFDINKWESIDRHSNDIYKNKWNSNNSISSCLTRVSLDCNNNYDTCRDDEQLIQKKNSIDSIINLELDYNKSKLIIFDYDDTILPTCSLTLYKHLNNNDIINELNKLSDAVLNNLNVAINVGTVVIVTNASSEWISQSCERYLPKVAEFLIEHKIRIISARDRFGNSLLAQKHWKYFIFIDLIEEQFLRQLKFGEPFSVISIGDGTEEREACMKLVTIFKNQGWTFKNLKFLPQPSSGCLTLQHVLLYKSFKNFIDMETSADLCIQFDKNQH